MSELEKCFPKHEVMIALGVIYLSFGPETLLRHKLLFIFTWMFWRPLVVCLASWVRMGKLYLHYFSFMIWICNHPTSKWLWCTIPRLSCRRKVGWILWLDFGARSSQIPSSTISSQNSWNLQRLMLSKCLV
jgi:hypothetical protein